MKKNKVTRLLALLLSSVMTISVAACGTTNDKPQEDSQTNNTVAEKSENASSDVATEENVGTLLCDEPTTLVVYGRTGIAPSTEDDQMVHDKILELTNVDLVYVGNSDYYNQRATYLSSGEQIDLMYESCWWATDLIAQGAYQDVTAYVQEYGSNFNAMVDSSYHSFVQWDGKYYGIGETNYMNLYGLFANKTMLDEIGVDIPTTIEELEKVCEKLLENDPDCYPIVANWTWLQRLYQSSFAEGFENWYDDEAGLLKDPFEAPGYLDFLTTVKGWYEKGYIASFCEPGSWDNDKYNTALMTGKCAFVSNNAEGFLDLADQIESQPEYVFAEPFAGEEGQRGFEPRPAIPYFFAVPSTSENAELAIKFLDWLMTEEARRLICHGIEGVHYNIADNGYLVKTDVYDNYTKCYKMDNVFLSELKEEPSNDNAKITAEYLKENGQNFYFGSNDAWGVNMNISSIPQDVRDKQVSDKAAVTEIIAKYIWTNEVDLAAVEKAIADYSANNSEYTKLRTEIYKNALQNLGITTDDIRASLEKK